MSGIQVSRDSGYVPVSRQDLVAEGRLFTSSSNLPKQGGGDAFLTWDEALDSAMQVGSSTNPNTASWSRMESPGAPPSASSVQNVAQGVYNSAAAVIPSDLKQGAGYVEQRLDDGREVLWDAGAATFSATARGIHKAGDYTVNSVEAIAEVVDADFQHGARKLNPLQVMLPETDLLRKVGYNPPVEPPKYMMTAEEAISYRLLQKPAEAAWDVGNSFVYKPVSGVAEVVRGLAADTIRVTNDYIVHPVIEPLGYAAGGVVGGTAYGLYRVTTTCASGAYRYVLSPICRGAGYALEWTGDGLVEVGSGELNYQGKPIEDQVRSGRVPPASSPNMAQASASMQSAAFSSAPSLSMAGGGRDGAPRIRNDEVPYMPPTNTLGGSNAMMSPQSSMTIPTRNLSPPATLAAPSDGRMGPQEEYVMVPKKEYEEYMHRPATTGSLGAPVRTLDAWPKIGSQAMSMSSGQRYT
mmetsp:Transcript_44616/g.105785  ORF Transcript_44616/g.105785 Transcript_44616/m.105785 type:complete len:466 (-) Transcript_44616:114-1511(-)